MAITGYDSLNDALRAWTTSSELEQQFDAFIQGAEADFNKVLRHPKMMTSVTLAASGRLTPLPTDWLETVSLTNLDANPDPLPMDFVTNADAEALDSMLSGGDIQHWSMEGTKIVAVPNPGNTPVNLRLVYYQQIPGLSTVNQSNWLIQMDPFLYLYACLRHVAPYLNNDARAVVWQTEYNARCNDLNLAGDIARFSGQRLVAKSRNIY